MGYSLIQTISGLLIFEAGVVWARGRVLAEAMNGGVILLGNEYPVSTVLIAMLMAIVVAAWLGGVLAFQWAVRGAEGVLKHDAPHQ